MGSHNSFGRVSSVEDEVLILLCEGQSRGYDYIHSCSPSFGSVGTDEMVAFKINNGISFAIRKISTEDSKVWYLRGAHV